MKRVELHFIGGPNDGMVLMAELGHNILWHRRLVVPEMVVMDPHPPIDSGMIQVRTHTYWLMPLGTKHSDLQVWAAVHETIRP